MILSVAYGIPIKESDDPYITIAEIALNGFAEAGIPGTFLVDYLPFLKYVPSWMPGASFKGQAAYWAKVTEDMREKPFLHVKDQLVSWIMIGFMRSNIDVHFSPDKRNRDPFNCGNTNRKAAR